MLPEKNSQFSKEKKTPDAGIYRPKFDLVFGRSTVYQYRPGSNLLSSTPEIDEKGQKLRVPQCIKQGVICDFRVRDLKKKVDKLRDVINASNVDMNALYHERIIDQKVFNMFKSPSITLLSKFDPEPKPNAAFLAMQQNPNHLISIMNQYTQLKNEMNDTVRKNKEDLERSRSQIPDRCRVRPVTPLGLNLQLARPPLIRKSQEYSELWLNSSHMNESSHKIHKFSSGTPRKVFAGDSNQANPYDVTNAVLDKVRPKSTGGFIDFNRAVGRKKRS